MKDDGGQRFLDPSPESFTRILHHNTQQIEIQNADIQDRDIQDADTS